MLVRKRRKGEKEGGKQHTLIERSGVILWRVPRVCNLSGYTSILVVWWIIPFIPEGLVEIEKRYSFDFIIDIYNVLSAIVPRHVKSKQIRIRTSGIIFISPFKCVFMIRICKSVYSIWSPTPRFEVWIQSCNWTPVECGLNSIISLYTVRVVVSSWFGNLTLGLTIGHKIT